MHAPHRHVHMCMRVCVCTCTCVGAHVVEDGQVVLDHHDVLVGHATVLLGSIEDEGSDQLGGRHALLDVEEGGGLVEHVAVGVTHGRRGDGEALQLAARECLDLAIDQVREVEPSGDLLPAVTLVALLEHDADRPAGHRAHVVSVQLHLHGQKGRRSRRLWAGTRAAPRRGLSHLPPGGEASLLLLGRDGGPQEADGLPARWAAARAAARQGRAL